MLRHTDDEKTNGAALHERAERAAELAVDTAVVIDDVKHHLEEMKMLMNQKLRVWWKPQIPCESFLVPVDTVAEGVKLLDVLADYDQFQMDQNVKPDYCNSGGLMMFDPNDDTDGPDGSWTDWYDEIAGENDATMTSTNPKLDQAQKEFNIGNEEKTMTAEEEMVALQKIRNKYILDTEAKRTKIMEQNSVNANLDATRQKQHLAFVVRSEHTRQWFMLFEAAAAMVSAGSLLAIAAYVIL